MFKRISVFLLAIALLMSVTACMPDAIFADDVTSGSEHSGSRDAADIYSFKFLLGEEDIELPVKYIVISARGWKISETAETADDDETAPNADAKKEDAKVYTAESVLESGEYSDYLPLSKGESVITARFYNDTDKQQSITDCKVVGIRLDAEYGTVPSFVIHKDDLSIGSRYDDVKESCGTPTYVERALRSTGEIAEINDVKLIDTEEETVSTLYYKLAEHSFISFVIDTLNNVPKSVVTVTIENDAEPYEPYDYSRELKYKSDSVDLYKGPNLLGKTFFDLSYKFEGNLYTLPIPVRRLIDDGWEFISNYGERIPMGTTADGLVMRKGNQAIKLMVHNYDTKYAHTAINCYAVNMEACLTGPNVSILFAKGVTLGSTEKDLVTALGKDFVKKHPVVDEEGNYSENAESFRYDAPDMAGCYIEKTVGDEYTVYSCVMPDDVPTITLPVSITDIGDTGVDLLGGIRKHIDIYVANDTHIVYKFYLQNCPEYVVDENKIIEEQLEAQRKKEKEEWEKQQKEKEAAENKNS